MAEAGNAAVRVDSAVRLDARDIAVLRLAVTEDCATMAVLSAAAGTAIEPVSVDADAMAVVSGMAVVRLAVTLDVPASADASAIDVLSAGVKLA